MYQDTLCILLSLNVLSFSVIHIITTWGMYISVCLVYVFILCIVFSLSFPCCFFPRFSYCHQDLGQECVTFSCRSARSGFTSGFMWDTLERFGHSTELWKETQTLCLAHRAPQAGPTSRPPGRSSPLQVGSYGAAMPARTSVALWKLHAWLEVPKGIALVGLIRSNER